MSQLEMVSDKGAKLVYSIQTIFVIFTDNSDNLLSSLFTEKINVFFDIQYT